MASYLLLWNPGHAAYRAWDKLPEVVARVKRGEAVFDNWHVRSAAKYKPGDRLYILKVGRGVCGIMGSGIFTRSNDGTSIRLDYNALLNPDKDPILAREDLKKKVPTVWWSPQASGHCLYADDALVESLWQMHLKTLPGG